MEDSKYMQMALRLAKRGFGSVETNPLVGCYIVKDGRVIGKGWHKKFGGPHAEINALVDCSKSGVNPAGAAMYVTLEPCCHQGKTPACTDAIIKAKISKVVAAMADLSEHASGKGIEQLRQAGIDVEVGIFETQAKILNAPFIKFAETGRCWVIVKWAQSIDGKLAWTDKAMGQWISNEKSRRDSHKLRRSVQGILVGINTVIADDPLLTVRPSKGKKPVRIVLDTNLKIPLDCKLFATVKKSPVIIVTSEDANQELAEKISGKGAEVLTVPTTQRCCDLEYLLNELSSRGIGQLLVEGGPTVISSFLKQRLADQVVIYIAPNLLGSEGNTGLSESMAQLTDSIYLHNIDIKDFDGDIRLSGFLKMTRNE